MRAEPRWSSTNESGEHDVLRGNNVSSREEQGVRETAGRGETQQVRLSRPEGREELLRDSELKY